MRIAALLAGLLCAGMAFAQAVETPNNKETSKDALAREKMKLTRLDSSTNSVGAKSLGELAQWCDQDRVDRAKAAVNAARNQEDELKALNEANGILDESTRCIVYINSELTFIHDIRKLFEDHGTPHGTAPDELMQILVGNELPEEFICLPDNDVVKVSQVEKMLVKWAQDHPEWLHEPAQIHLLAALFAAFPCRQVQP